MPEALLHVQHENPRRILRPMAFGLVQGFVIALQLSYRVQKFEENAVQLNHLNLSVIDVVATASFFETFFDFTLMMTKGDDTLAILKGDGSFTLVLTRVRQKPIYPKTFHIGFLLPSEEAVQEVNNRLRADYLSDISEVKHMRGGTLFYVYAPGGILVEVGCNSEV